MQALALCGLALALFAAQFSSAQAPAAAPPSAAATSSSPGSSAEALYLQLRSVGLDKSRVYHIREVTLERAAFHITFDDGTIAFTEGCRRACDRSFF